MQSDGQGQCSGQGDGVTQRPASVGSCYCLVSWTEGQGRVEGHWEPCEKGMVEMSLLDGAGIEEGGSSGAGRAGQRKRPAHPLPHANLISCGLSLAESTEKARW